MPKARTTNEDENDVLQDGEHLRVPLILTDAARVRPTRGSVRRTAVADARELLRPRHRPGTLALSDAEQNKRKALFQNRKRRLSDAWKTLGHRDALPEPDDYDDDFDEDDVDDDEDDPHSAVAAANAAWNERNKLISEAWRRPMTPFYLRSAGSDADVQLATRLANLLKLSAPLPHTASAATWPVPATAYGQPVKSYTGVGQAPLTPTRSSDPASSAGNDAREAAIAERNRRLSSAWKGDSGDPTEPDDPDAATAVERQRERWTGQRGGSL
jgi:hypothetical protein